MERLLFVLSPHHGQISTADQSRRFVWLTRNCNFLTGLRSIIVNYSVFLKKQPFIDFLCEIMRQSPCGRWKYGNDTRITNVEIKDVVEFFDPVFNAEFHDKEGEFLLKHCQGQFDKCPWAADNSFNQVRSSCSFSKSRSAGTSHY